MDKLKYSLALLLGTVILQGLPQPVGVKGSRVTHTKKLKERRSHAALCESVCPEMGDGLQRTPGTHLSVCVPSRAPQGLGTGPLLLSPPSRTVTHLDREAFPAGYFWLSLSAVDRSQGLLHCPGGAEAAHKPLFTVSTASIFPDPILSALTLRRHW